MAIKVINGKAIVVPDEISESSLISTPPTTGYIPNELIRPWLVNVLFIMLLILVLFILFKYILPFLARYSGFLVYQFKKGLEQDKDNKKEMLSKKN